MTEQLRIFISASTDPWFNLAVEECIFRQMPANQKVLYLWRNADTVVIGRGQNPWKECNTRRMEADQVKLARRQSGGGAVFHDLGNTNFTFMAGKPGYDKSVSTSIILHALASLGINASASGRNDLIVQTEQGERKISGSAYRETPDRGFHHGTLLLSADLSRLANYLNPDPKKLASKGIASVRSRVANLNEIRADIDHEIICEAIQHALLRIILRMIPLCQSLNISRQKICQTYQSLLSNMLFKKVGNGILAKPPSLPICLSSVLIGVA